MAGKKAVQPAAAAPAPKAEEARIGEILKRLRRAYGDVGLALDFSTPLELLIALILAAQCTDERVNQVTKSLFKKYRSAKDYAAASPAQLEAEIRPTGFYRQKAKAILACTAALCERFGGRVPQALEDLLTLPGVGRKTANIVIGNAFGRPAIGVDTHVARLAQRLGLSSNTDPDKIEADLTGIIPRREWVPLCHRLQAHGRRVCLARKPMCEACTLADLCPYPQRQAASTRA
jgi:endonuclease-3